MLTVQTYCPYSKRAKAILENYHLTPAPFVIELDIRRKSSLYIFLLHLHSSPPPERSR